MVVFKNVIISIMILVWVILNLLCLNCTFIILKREVIITSNLVIYNYYFKKCMLIMYTTYIIQNRSKS